MFNFKNENVFVFISYVRLWLPVLMFNYKNGKCICLLSMLISNKKNS